MIESILFGMSLLAIFVIWQMVVRRTALDHHRDKLFDLRESVRKYYLENGVGLDHKTYIELRRLINSQIRFLEDVSFVRLVLWESECKKNKELRECVDQFLNERFETEDPELAKYIKNVRLTAYRHSLSFMVYSSLGLTVLCYGSIPFVIVGVIFHAIGKMFKKKIHEVILLPIQKRISLESIEEKFGDFILKPLRKTISQESIEEVSSVEPLDLRFA